MKLKQNVFIMNLKILNFIVYFKLKRNGKKKDLIIIIIINYQQEKKEN